MAQKNFAGWAEYRRRRKTQPALAVGSSRVGLAPHPPQKSRGVTLFYLKRTFAFCAWRGVNFWGEFLPLME